MKLGEVREEGKKGGKMSKGRLQVRNREGHESEAAKSALLLASTATMVDSMPVIYSYRSANGTVEISNDNGNGDNWERLRRR